VFLLEDGRCGVHDARPEGCRLYPAFFDEEVRQAALDDLYCPHTDGFRLPRATGDAVARLAAKLETERRRRQAT
jgi:Fe-S-cluster containining protein